MTDISGWVDANHFTVGLRPEQQPVFHGALSKQSPAVRIRTGFVLNSCHGSWVQVIDKKGHTGWLGPESLEFVDDKTGDFLRRN